MQAFEQLGAFYLGRRRDVASGRTLDAPLLYDAKDLTTHAVVVGMTGSGKTGLCLSLLEEAAIDGVPAVAIDPKGDLANLLLTFPDLRPDDFAPWIDPGEAARAGATPSEYAAQVARRWREGLAAWGQDGDRIRRLREAAEFKVYTPGSSAGTPIRLLGDFAPPPAAVLDDAEALRDRITAAVSGLLGLAGVDADPVQSREFVLISTLLDQTWRDGRTLDLPQLVHSIVQPPFDRLGVFNLEQFFPAQARMDLAMRLNNVLASPSFAPWMQGEPLDFGRLLATDEGRPRLSIVSIAHLSDAERMFFTTLLLDAAVSWMRTQAGTSSLRALLYMDEVFGYLPPTANPPSKRPMLTLLKQARAFGLGVVLATQNPVDVDYKALSNAGTWFLGRLQTERDLARVLDGLEGASASAGRTFDRGRMEATLAGLGSRVFLMNNVHEDAPVVFETRWAMSYLRGPLTRDQIRALAKAPASRPAAPALAPPPPAPAPVGPTLLDAPPAPPPGLPAVYLAPAEPPGDAARLVYRPAVMVSAELHFVHAPADVDAWVRAGAVAPLGAGRKPDWAAGWTLDAPPSTEMAPRPRAAFEPLPPGALDARAVSAWSSDFAAWCQRAEGRTLWSCSRLKGWARVGEGQAAFHARMHQQAREARDLEVEKLRRKYEPRLQKLQHKLSEAEGRLDRERAELGQAQTSAALEIGGTLLGAFFGRRAVSTAVRGAARGSSKAAKEQADVEKAAAGVEQARAGLGALDAAFRAEMAELQRAHGEAAVSLEPVTVYPRKADTRVDRVALAWVPYRATAAGALEPLVHLPRTAAPA